MNNIWAINLKCTTAQNVMERMRREKWLLHSQYLFEALIRSGCSLRTFNRIRHEWFEAYFDHPPVPLDRIMRHVARKRSEVIAVGGRKRKWIRIVRKYFRLFYESYAHKIQAGTWRPPEERRVIGILLEEKWRELEELRVESTAHPSWGVGTNKRRRPLRMRVHTTGYP